jgi:thiol-disulfide isomerase/thioredoxin
LAVLSGALGWVNQFILVGTCYYFGALFFPISTKDRQLIVYIKLVAPFFLIYGSIPLIRGSLHLYPIVAICLLAGWLGIISKNYLLSKRKIFWTLFIGSSTLLFILFGYIFMSNWLSFCFSEKYKKGQQCVDFSMHSVVTGKNFRLYDIKSKVIILDFWNTSCGYCLKQFPEIQKITEDLSHKDVMVFAVHINHNHENKDSVIRNLFTNKAYTFNAVTVSDSISKKMDVQGVPMTIVLDSLKRIIFKGDLKNKNAIVFVNNSYSIIMKALE